MRIDLNKNFETEYKNQIWKGFTVHEVVAILGAVGILAIIAVAVWKILGIPLATGVYCGLPFAFPVLIVGFKRFDGLPLWEWLRIVKHYKATKQLCFETYDIPVTTRVFYMDTKEKEGEDNTMSAKANKMMFIVLVVVIISAVISAAGIYLNYKNTLTLITLIEGDAEYTVEPEIVESESEVVTSENIETDVITEVPSQLDAVIIEETTTADNAETMNPPQTNDTYVGLMYGSTGEKVTALQNDLNRMGYEVEVTGNYDEATLSAVAKLQGDHDVLASGWIDSDTYLLFIQE